jgi:hypothetical protein
MNAGQMHFSTDSTGTAPLKSADSAPRASVSLRVRSIATEALTQRDVAAWQDLESRAIEPNAYHSPCFVLPALQHLDSGSKAVVILVERLSAGSCELLGAAVVRRRLRSPVCALPHAETYVSRHSYLGVPLIDRHNAGDASEALLRRVRHLMPTSAGLVIRHIDKYGALLACLREVTQGAGRPLSTYGAVKRAMLIPIWANSASLQTSLRSRFVEVERCRRRMNEIGHLQWSAHRGQVSEEQIDDFLRLEHLGWKADAGTSLRSSASDEAFFRAMTARFSTAGRAFFTELKLDGRAVASTANYVSGDAGFAFKVGRDGHYRKFGVGILNEAELVRQAASVCADLRFMDSGAAQGSFIDKLWPQRRKLVTAFVPTSSWGAAAWKVLEHVRSLRAGSRSAAADHASHGSAHKP